MSEFEVFQAVLDLPDDASRAEYLDRVCNGDADQRSRLEALLKSHKNIDSFLGRPAVPELPESAPSNAEHDDEVRAFLSPATRDDSLGRIGHYEVLQVLGRGGFGVVFRAFDDVLQRVVAVKMMAPQLAVTSPARKRFLREARASAAIRHENVVQVYEVGEQPLPYLVMEFIPGETLQNRVDRLGPLDVKETLQVGRQIAEGLAAAHLCDLIHRDIKPGNVLLEEGSLRVKITDFGLARAADDASMTQSGVIAGTPLYMAPEQAQGQSLTERADLFSFGSVLYLMVTGRPPFRANNTLAVIKRVAEDTPRPIREIIPEAPQWLCDIITKLLAKKPEERFGSAREVADVLADCEAQLKTHARLKNYSLIPRNKESAAGKSRKWKRVGAAVVLLSVLGLAVTESVGITHLLPTPQQTVAVPPQANPKAQTNTPPRSVVTHDVPPAFTNSIGMEFVLVPKGKSWQGGGAGRPGDREVEIPADFYLGKYEVTQEEWVKVMGLNPSYFSRSGDGADVVKDIPDAELKRFPVEQVPWDRCQEFAARLNLREHDTGWVYRLPTLNEWLYACRGGPMADNRDSAFDFYLTSPTNTLPADEANFELAGLQRTCKVGSYKPNALGLFDMHGNVAEWTQDVGMRETGRWLRGGAWIDPPEKCRPTFPAGMLAKFRVNTIGLRLARVPAGVPATQAKAP